MAAALYVFEIWPFNVGGPIIKNGTKQLATNTQELPDILTEDKIVRAKTFDEYMSRGKLLEDKSYYSMAISEFLAASKLNPSKVDPLIQIGRMHLKNGDYIKSKISFEEALKIDSTSTNAKIYLGRTILSMTVPDNQLTKPDESLTSPNEAKTIFDSISTPTQAAKYYQGIIALYLGYYDPGKNLLKESIAIGGTDDLTAKAKNFLAAFDEFNANQGGQNIHLKTLLGRSYNQTGEYQMAIPLLYKVIKEKQDYRDAWILLGYAYLNIQKYKDSIDALERAKLLDTQKPETLFFLGLAYYGRSGDMDITKKNEDVQNYLTKAADYLELSRNNGFEPKIQIDQKLAEIYLQMKNYKKSAEQYENVIALNSQDINYFIKPVWIYIERLNQPAKAEVLAGKALSSHPDEAMSYNLLGWAKIGESKYDEADILLKKALELDPNLAAAYLNYGMLYEKRHLDDQAIISYKKAFQMGNGSSISSSAADKYNLLIGRLNNKDNTNILKASLLNQ
jgi:tetratricopeptide (TPR) repeat protein